MTPRRGPGQSWESVVDREIRRAQERGDFDNLKGAGRPLPNIDRPYDASWWIRRKAREEQLTRLPPALQLRKDRDDARAAVAAARSEDEVRAILEKVNAHIRYTNRTIVTGPPSSVMPLDVEAAVATWHRERADRPGPQH